jgi:tetratricopeptide (TPR) repeat protein
MAVLIEAFSVIVRISSIEKKFKGGWNAFFETIPNSTFCRDEYIARIGFMKPEDVQAFMEHMEVNGLISKEKGVAKDIAVVDQLRGPNTDVPWLTFGKISTDSINIMACALKGKELNKVAFPKNWKYEGSLSDKPGFAKPENEGDHLQFLRRDENTEVYLDLTTGKEVFVGRTRADDDAGNTLKSRLERLCGETLELNAKSEPLMAIGDENSCTPIYERLLELSQLAKEIAESEGSQFWMAHYSLGLTLRIIKQYEDALPCLRRAHALYSEEINTLKELVLCLGELKKSEEALHYSRKAVRLAPNDHGAWGNLAMCLITVGCRTEAKEAIDHAIRLNPQDPINRYIRDNFENYLSKEGFREY